jgi:hypothetical protein
MEESDSKTETFTSKLENNATVVKIVEYFYIGDILQNLKNNPKNIFSLLDEELIRVADHYKNQDIFNPEITMNLIEILIKKEYSSSLFVDYILLCILFHIVYNSDNDLKIHKLLLTKLNKLTCIKSNDIVKIIINKIKESFKKYYPTEELEEKED